jgi:hypothetical protein
MMNLREEIERRLEGLRPEQQVLVLGGMLQELRERRAAKQREYNGELTDREIQAGIDRTMIDVITRDARHNPNGLVPVENVRPAGAGVVVDTAKGSGFYEPKPLAPNPEIGLVDRMINAALPHGSESKAK